MGWCKHHMVFLSLTVLFDCHSPLETLAKPFSFIRECTPPPMAFLPLFPPPPLIYSHSLIEGLTFIPLWDSSDITFDLFIQQIFEHLLVPVTARQSQYSVYKCDVSGSVKCYQEYIARAFNLERPLEELE